MSVVSDIRRALRPAQLTRSEERALFAAIDQLLRRAVPDHAPAELVIPGSSEAGHEYVLTVHVAARRMLRFEVDHDPDPASPEMVQYRAARAIWAAEDAAREGGTPQIEGGKRPTTAPRSEGIVQNDPGAGDTDHVSPTRRASERTRTADPFITRVRRGFETLRETNARDGMSLRTGGESGSEGDPDRPAAAPGGSENRPTAAPRSGPRPEGQEEDEEPLDLVPVVRDLGGRVPLVALIAHLSHRPPHRVANSARILADRGDLTLTQDGTEPIVATTDEEDPDER